MEQFAYAVLRASLGAILLTHGLPKLFGSSHGSMVNPMAASIRLMRDVMGIPFAPQIAVCVMLLETLGALMLALGVLTRIVALAVACEMAGISIALGPTWPWIDRGIEYPVLLGLLALYIAIHGSGSWALDNLLSHRRAP